MEFPLRIVDWHTHLFNACYMPLESILNDVMGKRHSPLAKQIADLLVSLTGSSYKDTRGFLADTHFPSEEARNEALLDQIWKIAEHELLTRSASHAAVTKGVGVLRDLQFSSPVINRIPTSDVALIVDELSKIDYVAEGYVEPLQESAAEPPIINDPLGPTLFKLDMPFGHAMDGAEKAVKKALRAVNSLMDPLAWEKPENYMEFFLTMLKSEEDMVKKLFEGYGSGLPPIQIVHYMMDMQMAYPDEMEPKYPFFPRQVENMQNLQRQHKNEIFGFCAFDPRRPGNWLIRCEDAIKKGFIGFKFYPPLGYKPSGDQNTAAQTRTSDFFDFCVAGDYPIFTHCTPEGFQTNLKEGRNAHPNGWKTVLETTKWHNLRLCLGHAGGEASDTHDTKSPGWQAKNLPEWRDPDNFARIVTELCTTYPNVYCEVANMYPMLNSDNGAVFVANLERARTAAAGDGRPYDLMDKIGYGTDWHMPDMVDNTRRYCEIFLNIMNRPEYVRYIDKFFWQNAYKFMKIAP